LVLNEINGDGDKLAEITNNNQGFMRRLSLFSLASFCSIKYAVVKTLNRKNTAHYPNQKAPMHYT